MKKLVVLLGISILLTFLSGVRKSVELSPYPEILDGSGQNVRVRFPEVEGGGFPLMWWRVWPGLKPDEVHMTSIIRNGIGFGGDIIFWLGIVWALDWIWRRMKLDRVKNGGSAK